MKLLLHIFIILLIVSCKRTTDQNQKLTTTDSLKIKTNLIVKTKDTSETLKNPKYVDTLTSFKIFKDFAINFSPTRKPNSGVARLPEISDSILSTIKIVKNSQPKEFEKYLTLIFVKLYSAHLECCHQSYEIRKQPARSIDKEKDPLVYEFNYLTKQFVNKNRVEFISSNIGYNYVDSHKYLLDFEPIKKEILIIEQVHKNIKDGTYWK